MYSAMGAVSGSGSSWVQTQLSVDSGTIKKMVDILNGEGNWAGIWGNLQMAYTQNPPYLNAYAAMAAMDMIGTAMSTYSGLAQTKILKLVPSMFPADAAAWTAGHNSGIAIAKDLVKRNIPAILLPGF